MYSKYKYKFYLNANHAIYINNELGKFHSHTWEITLIIKNFNVNFVQFNDIEDIIGELLSKYQNANINTVEPFDKINPTLENICKYFNKLLFDRLIQENIRLDTIEICESPKRAFIIENDNVIENSSENNTSINNDYLLEKSIIEKQNEEIINGILNKYKHNNL